MHAVMITVRIDESREDEARQLLKDVVVPMGQALAGFQRGYWARALESDIGRSVLLFDTESSARAAVDQVRSQGPPEGMPVTLDSVEAFEVLHEA